MEKYYDTRYISINADKYCAYCGRKIEVKEEIDHYQTYQWYCCDCEDAQKEHQISLQIAALRQQYPEPKYKITAKPVIEKL